MLVRRALCQLRIAAQLPQRPASGAARHAQPPEGLPGCQCEEKLRQYRTIVSAQGKLPPAGVPAGGLRHYFEYSF